MSLNSSNVFSNENKKSVIIKSYNYDSNVMFLIPSLDKCKLEVGGRSKLIGLCIPITEFANITTYVEDSYLIEHLRIIGYSDKVSSVVDSDDKYILMINCVNDKDPIYRYRTSMVSKIGKCSYNLNWLFERIEKVFEDLK